MQFLRTFSLKSPYQLYLFCPENTPRIAYMAQWAGQYLFGQPLQLVYKAADLPQHGVIINYSTQEVSQHCVHILPHGLLHKQVIENQHITISHQGELPIFFQTKSPLGFDVLAAAFYLITRYEEYLPHELDAYGRFAHTNSLAFKANFLHRPLVDEWMQQLKQAITVNHPTVQFAQRQFSFIPTYDIDMAWSYAHKGFWRNIGGGIKQMLFGKISDAVERLNVCLNGVRDPFDVFADLRQLHKRHGLVPIWFFLIALHQKGFDKNIDPSNEVYRYLMADLATTDAVALHASWQAAHSQTLLLAERNLLQSIAFQPITTNRYHYVKFALPQGLQRLVPFFSKDYSMGYGSINGFRASTCSPYFWYDLSTETTTTLEIMPFAYMEANSIFEQKDDAEAALAELERFVMAVKKVDGAFITIFHNHLIGLDASGRTWWNMYERFLTRHFSVA